MVTIKLKRINGRNYFLATDKGKYVTRRKQKGSKLSLENAKNIFRQNQTFIEGRKATRVKLTNVTEFTKSQTITRNEKKRPLITTGKNKHNSQITLSAKLRDGTVIHARSSQIKGRKTQTAIKEATVSLFERIDQHFNQGSYDATEGLKRVNEVLSLTQGYVYYKDLNKGRFINT